MPEFDERLARHMDELKWLYCELYHNDRASFDALIALCRAAYDARGESLRALDRARLQHPDWYKDNGLLGMCLYVKQFAGNLRGVREKLPYLTACGVNYLHLMPLLDTVDARSDGGYAVADFRRVKPELGTMEDLSDLTRACHERGISCCLDFVMNHTSEDHEWARRARAGEAAYRDYYFFYPDRTVPDAYERTVPQVFPTTAPGNFTWLEDAQSYVLTSFYPYQWDLNYKNPAVFNAMMDNMLFLANRGIDVLRVDAVPYIWKELGTDCRNLPQVHTIVRMARMICEIVCPGTLLLGEVVMAPEKLAPYFGTPEKPECHMLYNATTMCTTWHTVATGDVRLMRHQLDALCALPKAYVFLNYLRCHDDIGWGLDYPFLARFGMEEVPHKAYLNAYLTGRWPGSAARGELYNDDPRLGDARLCGTTASLCGAEVDRETALTRIETLHAFLLTLSGLPMLYSGDEIGQLNDYGYHDDPLRREDSRYLHRGAMCWADAERRTDPRSWPGAVYAKISALTALRKRHSVFGAAARMRTVDTGSDRVLGIERRIEGQTLLALFSFSDREERVDLDGAYVSLTDGARRLAGTAVLPAYGFAWMMRE